MSIHSKVRLSSLGAALLIISLAACGGSTGRDGGTGAGGGTATGGGAETGGGTATGGGTGTGGGDATGGGEGEGDGGIPEILANSPRYGATNVALTVKPSVTFTQPMRSATLTTNSFSLTTGTSVAVSGAVSYANGRATFSPLANLPNATLFIATVTTAALSAPGVALANNHVWTFTTGANLPAGMPVNLGTAGDFVILAKTGVSTVPPSAISGDVGVSPAAATYLTGFSLTADATNVFSRSTQVSGQLFAANYAAPTPSNLTTAVGDMETAYTDAASRAPSSTELGAGNISGMSLTAGVYKWGTGLLVATDVTLTGSPTDVFIFEIAQDLTFSSGARVVLAGGLLPRNIFWQVAGMVDLGTSAHLEGVVLTQTAITLRTGATVNGRLLAQTAVNIAGATVVQPSN